MAYQRKHKCYRCDGMGRGVIPSLMSEFEKTHIEWTKTAVCQACSGNGYNLYDFRPERYKGKFKNVNWEGFDIVYEDFASKYKCVCGGELFFNGDGMLVCNCGRIYKLNIHLSIDESHLSDMKYWEEYNEKD